MAWLVDLYTESRTPFQSNGNEMRYSQLRFESQGAVGRHDRFRRYIILDRKCLERHFVR
jgi:hypothetical protein